MFRKRETTKWFWLNSLDCIGRATRKTLTKSRTWRDTSQAIYVLYHGAMPVYIGRGAMSARLRSHAKEGSKKEQFWDRFSWFVIGKAKSERELEALLLEALPFYVRSLNKQSGRLSRKLQVAAPSREINDVALPKLAPGRNRR